MVVGGAHEDELRNDRRWRIAVWALRFGFLVLVAGIAGLVLGPPWIFAVGVVLWLAAAAVTLTGVFRARDSLPEPRPGFWPMRWMLLHDTFHPRRSGARP
jgi:hypothetical protein